MPVLCSMWIPHLEMGIALLDADSPFEHTLIEHPGLDKVCLSNLDMIV